MFNSLNYFKGIFMEKTYIVLSILSTAALGTSLYYNYKYYQQWKKADKLRKYDQSFDTED